MTTLGTRETVRDALVTLFTDNGAWQAGFGHEPTAGEADGQSPLFVITSFGTHGRNVLNTAPTTYRFQFSSYVLVGDPEDPSSWGAAEAEDKLDELDREVREIVRDNTPDGSYGIELEGPSRPSYAMMGGEVYRVEDYVILAEWDIGT